MLACVLSLVGCSGSSVCPAIGWFNEVTVQADGNSSGVANVELCDDDRCFPANPGTEWTFTTDMGTPEELTIRTYDGDGRLIGEERVRPEWVRVGGTEECGGPHQATVTL